MSDTLAHYSFIPWFRQGLSTRILEKDHYAAPDEEGAALVRANLDIQLYVENTAKEDGALGENVINKQIAIYGPGDIMGVSDRAIIRTEPRNGVANYEANNLAYIEFYEEDFPWRYTPVNPDDNTVDRSRRLRPWLTLVVLKRDQEEFTLQQKNEGLASFTVSQRTIDAAFPKADELWAWAHVQINQKLDHSGGSALLTEVDAELDADPDMGISRLICPRKLQKNTPYSAFLIPSFETGRLSGLGLEMTGTKAQKASWTMTAPGNDPSEESWSFPIYFQWNFHTGAYGDFETLVSILEPVVTDPENGKMPMDVQSPGFGLDGMAHRSTLGFEGALKPPNFVSDTFLTEPGNVDFKDQLRKVLNLSVDLSEDQDAPGNTAKDIDHPFYSSATDAVDDPIIVPPTYGIWHAMIKKVPNNPPLGRAWVHQLNLDPRYRAAAGLGTKTVQKEQENLMEEAWKQVGEINKANEKIRRAELSKTASSCIYKKHLRRGSKDRFLRFTSAMHNVVSNIDQSQTLNQQFRESRIPVVAKSASFRRIVRPNRKVNRKLNRQSASLNSIHQSLLKNFNKDEAEAQSITTAKLKADPANTLTFTDAFTAINFAQSNYSADPNLLAKDAFLQFFNPRLNDKLADRPSWITAINNDGELTAEVRTRMLQLVNAILAYELIDGAINITIRKAEYETFFGNGSSGKRYLNLLILKDGETKIDHIGSATTQLEIQQFQSGFSALQSIVNNETSVRFELPSRLEQLANLDAVGVDLQQKLDPVFTISKRVISQIKVWDGSSLRRVDELKPVMAHPEFEDPVYVHLKKLSQDFILPNVEKLPQDSITILQTNQRFIESYMAGLNHEMARELLWREFPTDQRGTYFRQFWDVRDNLFEDDPEKQFDIKKMHQWNQRLGNNRSRQWNENDPQDDGNIVLVVRGQLLLKYPNTMVFAQRAAYDSGDATEQRRLADDIDANIKYPLFSAELEPDIFLFGFDLSIDDARGQRIRSRAVNPATADPGWFFVFKERPGQIKFGLDDYADEFGDESKMPNTSNPDTWNDLSWEHLVDQKEDLASYTIQFNKNLEATNLDPSKPRPEWGSNSAELASILYQNPVIFARHAGEMLPEDED
ncbi:MAG: hypothetical protein AAF990_23765 [Bacteroidota bacterium]